MFLILSLCSVVFSNYLPALNLLDSIACPSYSCASSTQTKPSSLACMWSNSSTSVYLWPCTTGSFCNTTSGLCQPTVSVTTSAYVGEPCGATAVCSVGSCTNSTCQGTGLNKLCTSHDQCNPGLRCFSGNNTCQPQLQVSEIGCRSYLDCVNWATCNITGTNGKGVCVGYSSLPLGSIVSDCNGGFSYMCKYGSCNKPNLFSSVGVCNFPAVSNYLLPKTCTNNNQCVGSNGGQIVTSSCDCGVNRNGTSYCAPFLGDEPGQNMLSVWSAALKLTGGCNTARRSADGCLKMIQLFKNTTQATLSYYSYATYIANDDCVKANINDDYWMISGLPLFSLSAFALFILV